jgi:hypothetical protein
MEPKSEVDKRRSRHRNLCTNASNDPFILKFPPEIAAHIFFLSMTEYDHEPDSTLALKKLPTPFLLGSVCQGWRQLARSTPQLWSTISFNLVKPPKRKTALPQFIDDWLQRSRSLPLDLWIYDSGRDEGPLQAHSGPIIDALNQHSGRWRTLYLRLSTPSFFGLFCGTSPPSNLRSLQLIPTFEWEEQFHLPTFRMNSRPSPTRLIINNFPVLNIDIMWDKLEYLLVWDTTFDGCIELMQRASYLQSCSLSMELFRTSSPHSTGIVRHLCLRKLDLFDFPVDVLIHWFLNLMELPSLKEYHYDSDQDDILADSLVSLLNRSGCRLQVLKLQLGGETQLWKISTSCSMPYHTSKNSS